MRTNEFHQLDATVHVVAQHACHALLALDDLRFSHDPALREAYREVHDLIGDLGCLRIQLGTMQLASAKEIGPPGASSRPSAPGRPEGKQEPGLSLTPI